jgi:uncharacterized protein YybS (DUF2232 family)
MAASARARERSEPRAGGVFSTALLSAAIFSLVALVPVLGAVAVVSPLPILVQRLRRGLGTALLSSGVAASAVGWLFSPGLALGFLLVLVAPGLLIAEAMARGRGLRRGCAWAFLLLGGEIAMALLFAAPAIAPQMLDFFNVIRSPEFLAELRTRLPEENVTEWASQAAVLHSVMRIVYPGAFVIMAALIVLANAALLRYYLARRDPGWLEGGEFETVRWPLGLVVLFVVSAFSLMFPALRSPAYNVLLVAAFFFALQGLAVTAYYAHRLGGPPLLRAGLIALVLLNPWAPEILGLVGLFDTWVDFRKWADLPKAEER